MQCLVENLTKRVTLSRRSAQGGTQPFYWLYACVKKLLRYASVEVYYLMVSKPFVGKEGEESLLQLNSVLALLDRSRDTVEGEEEVSRSTTNRSKSSVLRVLILPTSKKVLN